MKLSSHLHVPNVKGPECLAVTEKENPLFGVFVVNHTLLVVQYCSNTVVLEFSCQK